MLQRRLLAASYTRERVGGWARTGEAGRGRGTGRAAGLLVHLTLRPTPSPTDPSKTVYVISEHEDFYHPDDLAALVVPPLILLIRLGLHAATFACRVNARVFGVLGYWSVRDGEGEPLPPVADDEERLLRGKKGRKDD
ncbi:hypothetical protein OH76DRAFT_1490883 [Lentinus brumalis]|uniref:SigF-like NTF2-like domain-containing protein n=1 Tax=Lentinus brumalis TaxID=2498619 RepID=A0A371CHG2_9APHY|nr:hypothetical protein OH76DRAFT_1490883 [Polyporus brumalis]